MAMKNRTRTCSSFGEKLNVGIRNCRYGRTPFRSRPGCGFSFTVDVVADGGDEEPDPGDAAACGVGAGNALICCCCSGVFSPLNDGSCKNFRSHAGSTRAPSLDSLGGNKSLPSAV